MILSAVIQAIGLVTPGMENWRAAQAVLRGEVAYQPTSLSKHKLQLLPANERRRATPLITLALRAIEDCLGIDADRTRVEHDDTLRSVFACSGGDMGNLHGLCEQLAKDPRGISPTAFHNSVHNAVAGYWSIGGRARAASVSLCAHDASFVAGLLEALALVAEAAAPVLLVVYDSAVPVPIYAKRRVTPDFAVALLLAPVLAADSELSRLAVINMEREKSAVEGSAATSLVDPVLEALRLSNPAARALPLLRLIANATPGAVVLADDAERWQVRCEA